MVAWLRELGQNILEAGVVVREASLLLGKKKSNGGDVGIHLAFPPFSSGVRNPWKGESTHHSE